MQGGEAACPSPADSRGVRAYGEVLEATGDFRLINAGLCQRHHDRAVMDFGPEGRAGISIFRSEPRSLPYSFDLIERHPEGSQAFLPIDAAPVPRDRLPWSGGRAEAFLTDGAQGINLRRGTWHGVLTPLAHRAFRGGGQDRRDAEPRGIPLSRKLDGRA